MPSSNTQEAQAGIYRQQHGGRNTSMVVASGSVIRIESGGVIDGSSAVGSFTFATGEIAAADLAGNLSSGTIPLGGHLFGARQLASGENFVSGTSAKAAFWGGLLNTQGDPAMLLTSSGDQSFYLNYVEGSVVGIKLPPVAMPVDLATAPGMTVELFGESFGTATASDAKSAFDVRCWSGIGDTEMGSTHPDFTSTPSWKSITIASGDITKDILNITLVPQAHAGRKIRLYDARIRYTRSS